MSDKTFDMAYRPDADLEKIFGGLVEGRECGACAVCCTHLKIDTPELRKEAGIACEHCTGTGCAIYETRYPVCRQWHCLWRFIDAMPEEARPDKSKIIFSLQRPKEPEHPFTKLFIGGWSFDGADKFGTDLAQDLLAMLSQGDLPVWIATPETDSYLAHPSQAVVEVVMERRPARDENEAVEAQKWNAGIREKL